MNFGAAHKRIIIEHLRNENELVGAISYSYSPTRFSLREATADKLLVGGTRIHVKEKNLFPA